MNLSNIFNGSAALAKGLGSAASGAASAAGKFLSGAGSAASAAFKDACPGISVQYKKYRTDDGNQFYTDSQGKYKLCERKTLFGKNDVPFYYDGSQEHPINSDHFKAISYGTRTKSSRGRKHKKATMERKNKKSINSRKHKKATMERKHKKASKKRSMKHKSW
jgi:hypothetical protein